MTLAWLLLALSLPGAASNGGAPSVAGQADPVPAAAPVVTAGDEAAPPAATVGEQITVTATGLPVRLAEAPAAVTVLDRETLASSPAVALDDALRQVPGFQLFRRSGSTTANPTSQGATLRGLGGSATSRALVLADGVPLVDAFGGWVQWGRLPRLALERVEVVRGGASDLYGSGALAGVIQLLRREPQPAALDVEAAAGERDTAQVSLWGSLSGPRETWSAVGSAERFTTDGHVPLAEPVRGAVDTAAGSERTAAELTVERRTASLPRLFLRAGHMGESRTNGTALQDNSTRLTDLAAGADLGAGGGDLTLRLWGVDETYEQTFTAVAADRASERLIRDQRVPSRAWGGSGRWVRGLGDRLRLLAGVDGRRVRGSSDERAFLPTGAVVPSSAGGTQEAAAAYLEALADLHPRLSLTGGLRWDTWRNTPQAAAAGPRRDASAVSPRLALRWQASERWSATASGYRAFRAPTLNELYRSFRVGDVSTAANPALGPETLSGAEAGVAWLATRGPTTLSLRGTLFWMELSDAIANVTVGSGPAGIQRRRENLGRTRSRGWELEGEAAFPGGWTVEAGWLQVDATVERFAADPTLVGRQVPQVSPRQASLGLSFKGERLGGTLLGRWASSAFDDDRNQLPLGDALIVDLRLEHALRAGVTLFAAAENLLDDDYLVGRTPLETVGGPRLLRAGVRYRHGG